MSQQVARTSAKPWNLSQSQIVCDSEGRREQPIQSNLETKKGGEWEASRKIQSAGGIRVDSSASSTRAGNGFSALRGALPSLLKTLCTDSTGITSCGKWHLVGYYWIL